MLTEQLSKLNGVQLCRIERRLFRADFRATGRLRASYLPPSLQARADACKTLRHCDRAADAAEARRLMGAE